MLGDVRFGAGVVARGTAFVENAARMEKVMRGHMDRLQTKHRSVAKMVNYGLAYGMGGSIQPAGENVILITPPGVQVSAEERQRFLEERGFFNQA